PVAGTVGAGSGWVGAGVGIGVAAADPTEVASHPDTANAIVAIARAAVRISSRDWRMTPPRLNRPDDTSWPVPRFANHRLNRHDPLLRGALRGRTPEPAGCGRTLSPPPSGSIGTTVGQGVVSNRTGLLSC